MLPLLLLWRRVPPRAVTPVFLGLWFAATSSSTSLSSILPLALDRPVATLLAATRCKRFACSWPWQEAPKMMSRRKKQVVRPLGPTCCPPKISSIRTPSGCSACTSSLSQPREALKKQRRQTCSFASVSLAIGSGQLLARVCTISPGQPASASRLIACSSFATQLIKPTHEAFRCLKSPTKSLYMVRFPCATPFGHPETPSEQLRKRLIFSSGCNSSENNPEHITKTSNMNTTLSKLKGEPNDQTEIYNFFFSFDRIIHSYCALDGWVCVREDVSCCIVVLSAHVVGPLMLLFALHFCKASFPPRHVLGASRAAPACRFPKCSGSMLVRKAFPFCSCSGFFSLPFCLSFRLPGQLDPLSFPCLNA